VSVRAYTRDSVCVFVCAYVCVCVCVRVCVCARICMCLQILQMLCFQATNTEIKTRMLDMRPSREYICISVLQCVAVCCSVLQCVAVRCSVCSPEMFCHNLWAVCLIYMLDIRPFRKHICISVLQCVAVCCSALQCVTVRTRL